jgi:hypothetical protein
MDVHRIGSRKPKFRSSAFRRQILRGTPFSQGRTELATGATPGRERFVRLELRTIDRNRFNIRPLITVNGTTRELCCRSTLTTANGTFTRARHERFSMKPPYAIQIIHRHISE